METYKRFYKGIFSGQKKKNLRINRYTQEEVLSGIMEYIPKNDEGVLEIQEIDFKTKERKTIKKVMKDDIPCLHHALRLSYLVLAILFNK